MKIVVNEPPSDGKTAKENGVSARNGAKGDREETKETGNTHQTEEEDIFDPQRTTWRIMAIVSVIFYFLYRHIWQKENQLPKVLILSIGVEITLLFMVMYPKWKSNDLHKIFGDSSVQMMLGILLITMMFDICGIFQNMFGGVNILILIARVSRVGLYYFLVANFESDKVKEKRQALQNEISQIKKETDLNAILKKLDDKCENTDEVLKAAIQKGIEVHNDNRRKKKVRHGLLKASFMRDDTEVDPTRINEVKLKDINRIIDSIDDHQEEFFNDDFNFLTMEDQYDLKMLLDSSEDLEFDVFDLKNQTNGNEMYVFGMHIMTKEAYLEEYRIDKMKLQNFLYAIQESYNPVAYHNKTHATDVSQTVYYFMKSCDVIDICKLSRTEQMSMLLAGFMQDVDHPGYTNSFLINTNDPLSLRYNDKSVLENYHIAMAFKIMKGCEQCDIFDKVSMKQNREIRKLIVNFILATDMANHFSKMFALEQRSSEDDFDPAGIDKEITTEFIFHVADIIPFCQNQMS